MLAHTPQLEFEIAMYLCLAMGFLLGVVLGSVLHDIFSGWLHRTIDKWFKRMGL